VDGAWVRAATGEGLLFAHPPRGMGRVGASAAELRALEAPERAPRFLAPLDEAAWRRVPPEDPAWPAYDPAWAWTTDAHAVTAWDLRWGPEEEPLAPERQRRPRRGFAPPSRDGCPPAPKSRFAKPTDARGSGWGTA
jgi:hypothetical protein